MPTPIARSPSTQPIGPRARRRVALEQAILDVGRAHLASHGAAALSMRAIARELAVAPSALYRYVESRDELLTRLIVEAYTSLGDALDAAEATVGPRLDRRWSARADAMRTWGLGRPHQWALIYGSPVPDYRAPAERTTPIGTRIMLGFAQLRADADRVSPRASAVTPAGIDAGMTDSGMTDSGMTDAGMTDAVRAATELAAGTAELGVPLDPRSVISALAGWTLLIGAVSSEVFGYLGEVADPDGMFRELVDRARLVFFDKDDSADQTDQTDQTDTDRD